jgi:hypothetical protein
MRNTLEHPFLQQGAALGFDANAPLTWREWRDEFRATMKYPALFFIVIPTVLSILISLVGSGKITLKVVSKETQRTCAAMCYLSSVLFVFSGCCLFAKMLPNRAEINKRKYLAELAQQELLRAARLLESNDPDSLERRQVNPLVAPSGGGTLSISEGDLSRHLQGPSLVNSDCSREDGISRIEAWLNAVEPPIDSNSAP